MRLQNSKQQNNTYKVLLTEDCWNYLTLSKRIRQNYILLQDYLTRCSSVLWWTSALFNFLSFSKSRYFRDSCLHFDSVKTDANKIKITLVV